MAVWHRTGPPAPPPAEPGAEHALSVDAEVCYSRSLGYVLGPAGTWVTDPDHGQRPVEGPCPPEGCAGSWCPTRALASLSDGRP